MKTWRLWSMLVGFTVPIVITLVTPTAPVAGALALRACDLLALTDVTGALGTGFAHRPDVALTGGPNQSHCAYHMSGGNVVLSLHNIIVDSGLYLQREQAEIARQLEVTVTPVAGLGPGAFYFQAPDARATPGLFQLHFGKGPRLVTLWVATGGRPNVAATQALARIAYARLP